MSEINSHDDIQTLPQEREKLYQLVWSEPAERITALYALVLSYWRNDAARCVYPGRLLVTGKRWLKGARLQSRRCLP